MADAGTARERGKADRTAALLDAATTLFAQRGFAGVSLEQLGAAVGVSGPAVYRHFANKQAVLAAVRPWGVRELPQGRNWVALPEGLCLEFIQAAGNAVAQALAVRPRG